LGSLTLCITPQKDPSFSGKNHKNKKARVPNEPFNATEPAFTYFFIAFYTAFTSIAFPEVLAQKLLDFREGGGKSAC